MFHFGISFRHPSAYIMPQGLRSALVINTLPLPVLYLRCFHKNTTDFSLSFLVFSTTRIPSTSSQLLPITLFLSLLPPSRS